MLPVTGINVKVITSDGSVIDHALPGAGEKNEYCSIAENRPLDRSENPHSLGVLITFVKLRILDLGDLTWDKELQLMCPDNRIGHVDILVVSHHGLYLSSTHALVDGLHPRVAIMNNSATKGGRAHYPACVSWEWKPCGGRAPLSEPPQLQDCRTGCGPTPCPGRTCHVRGFGRRRRRVALCRAEPRCAFPESAG